jgi:hypothetical protein
MEVLHTVTGRLVDWFQGKHHFSSQLPGLIYLPGLSGYILLSRGETVATMARDSPRALPNQAIDLLFFSLACARDSSLVIYFLAREISLRITGFDASGSPAIDPPVCMHSHNP